MRRLRLLVTGSGGRMGRAVIEAANSDAEVEIVAAIDAGEPLHPAIERATAVIDFSHHAFTPELAGACARMGKHLVVGTTGHEAAELGSLRAASEMIPLVLAPNFSVGVNTLFWLTRRAAEILGDDFDREVIEMHHNQKIDAPSGTAKRLGEILCDVGRLEYETNVRHGRHGNLGSRARREIGMHAMRGGDVVGDHTVVFAATGERVELTHRASNRQTFALGALRAAKWLDHQPPGLYDMQDVLGLK